MLKVIIYNNCGKINEFVKLNHKLNQYNENSLKYIHKNGIIKLTINFFVIHREDNNGY